MDVKVKPEPIDIDADTKEQIEPIVERHIKEENELIIDSDWLPTKYEDEENEYYQEFLAESNQNNVTETVVKTDGGYVKYVIEHLDESDDSDSDYEEDDDAMSDDMCTENDSSEKDNFFAADQGPQEAENIDDESEFKSVYQLELTKWIAENYINRECPVCKENLPNYKELQRHVTERHQESIEESESNYFFSRNNCGVCKKCNQEFITKYSRYVHSTKHSEVAPNAYYIHNCKICNYKSKRSYVQNHVVKKHPEVVQEFKPSDCITSLKCPLCSNTYLKRLHLCYHFMDKHPYEYKSKLHFNCPLCQHEHFTEKELFLNHLIEDHFLNSWEILNYRKVFEDKEYFACRRCNRLFFQNDICKLLSHFLKHKSNFYWSCQFCNKRISFKTSPLSHMCMKMVRYYEKGNGSLSRNSDSKVENLQEFEKHIAHVCPFCKKEFSKMLQWRHHMKTDHEIDTLKGLQMKVDDNDNNKLRCQICYTVVANLPEKIHAHCFQHLPYKPYKCIICLKILDSFKMAVDHVLNRCKDEDDPRYDIRSILRIQCSFCNFQEMDDIKSVLKHYENEHNYFEDFFIKESDNSMTCKICQKKYVQYEKKSCFQHLHHHFDEKTFKCKLCMRSYPTFKSISEHLLQFHNAKPLNKDLIEAAGDKTSLSVKSDDRSLANASKFTKFLTFVCPECNESMTSKQNWLTHIRTHHSFFDEPNLCIKEADGSVKCPTCNIPLDTRPFQQRKHKLTHMSQKSFMCNLCYDRSISLEGIYLHFRRKHFSQGKYECPICKTILQTEYERTEHIKKVHPRKEWPVGLCLICYKILSSKLCLSRHMDTHNADRFRYTCDICGTKILELRDFNAHMDRHKIQYEQNEKVSDGTKLATKCNSSKSSDPNCTDINCENETDQKSTIKKWHVLNEFEEFISYVCPECNEGMTTQEHWHNHIREQHNFFNKSHLYTKEADGSLKCPICSISMDTRAFQQQRHKLTHMPYKSFMCNLCNDRSTFLDGIYVHFRRRHFTQGIFNCPICTDVLQTDYERIEHLKKNHSPNEWPNNMCFICYRMFSNTRVLNHHMDTHNENRFTYNCVICGTQAFKLKDFKAHMNNHKIRGEIKEMPSADIAMQSSSTSSQSNCNSAIETGIEPAAENINKIKKSNVPSECEEFVSCKIKEEMCDDISQQYSFANSCSNDSEGMETERKNFNFRITSPCASPSSGSNDSNDNVFETVSGHINKDKKSQERNEYAKYMSFACPECDEGMTTQEDWHNHIKSQHTIFDESNLYIKEANGSLKCPTCRITIDTRPYPQQRHKLTHMKYKSFICNLCYERYSSLDGIRAHFRRKHFGEGTFECPICFKVQKTLHERTEHLKNVHTRTEWPDRMCTICYKIYSNKSRLNNHMITHNADRFKYTCDVCGIRICNVKNFKLHIEKHKNRGETGENWTDTKSSQIKLGKNQSTETGFDIAAESKQVNKRKSLTSSSKTKKPKKLMQTKIDFQVK